MAFPEFRYRGEYLGSNYSLTLVKTFLSTTMRLKAMHLKMDVNLTHDSIGSVSSDRGEVHQISSFSGLTNLSRKNSHHVSYSMIRYFCVKYEKYWFFIMWQHFSFSLGFREHFLSNLTERCTKSRKNLFIFQCRIRTQFTQSCKYCKIDEK